MCTKLLCVHTVESSKCKKESITSLRVGNSELTKQGIHSLLVNVVGNQL
jgi:hypothetical protein